MPLNKAACDFRVEFVVLLRDQPSKMTKPVRYWSRSLTGAERVHGTTQREFLAIFLTALPLRSYLEGALPTGCIDRYSLRQILNWSDVSGRFPRWRLRLADFDFDVTHRAGGMHQAADALSRLRTDGKKIAD